MTTISACVLWRGGLHPDLLARTVSSLRACSSSLEIVVLYCGSQPSTELVAGVDRFIGAPSNGDYASLLRLVVDSTTGDHILHVLDAWEFLANTSFLEQAVAVCASSEDVGCVRLSLDPWTYWRSPAMSRSEVRHSSHLGLRYRVFGGIYRGLATDFAHRPFLSPRDRYTQFLPGIRCPSWRHLERVWGYTFHARYGMAFLDRGFCAPLGGRGSIARWAEETKTRRQLASALLLWLRDTQTEVLMAHERFRSLRPALFSGAKVTEIHHDGSRPLERGETYVTSQGLQALRISPDVLKILRFCNGSHTITEICQEICGKEVLDWEPVLHFLLDRMRRETLLVSSEITRRATPPLPSTELKKISDSV